jgi:hypothetical protein
VPELRPARPGRRRGVGAPAIEHHKPATLEWAAHALNNGPVPAIWELLRADEEMARWQQDA